MEEKAGKKPQQTPESTPKETGAEISPELRQTHKETEAEQMDRRHKIIAQRAEKKAIDALAQILPEDMSANEARQLLKTAQDIERKLTDGKRDPEKQREDVQALLDSVWKSAKTQA